MRKGNKFMSPEEIAEVISLYNKGMPQKQIARKLGRDDTSIGYQLRKKGIKTPGRLRGEKNQFHRGGARHEPAAITQVTLALRNGTLKRPDHCQWCRAPNKLTKSGSSYIHAHHYDYNKPLDVIFLCNKCHHEWHQRFQAIPKKKQTEIKSELALF